MSYVGSGSTVGSWKLTSPLGAGLFGEVYSCFNVHTNIIAAAKIKQTSAAGKTFWNEAFLQRSLSLNLLNNHSIGIPKVFDYISTSTHEILVMELLGPSLVATVSCKSDRRFSIKTVLMIGARLIRLLGFIHSKHIFHGDISEDNIVIGQGASNGKLFLIDFGKSIVCDDNGSSMIDVCRHSFSVNEIHILDATTVNQTTEVSKVRDSDLFGALAVLMILYNPYLAASVGAHSLITAERCNWKSQNDITALLEGFPTELHLFMVHFVQRPTEIIPNYTDMENIFLNGLYQRHFVNDGNFDWLDPDDN